MNRRRLLLLLVIVMLLVGACALLQMPGRSFDGPLPAATTADDALAKALIDDVTMLAETIGERNYHKRAGLDRASAFVRGRFTGMGYDVVARPFTVDWVELNGTFDNLEVEVKGSKRPDEIVLIGAHYDTALGTPGANDNGSGMAVLFALAASTKQQQPARTVRFVAFANEEPPFFDTPHMGSRRYAQGVKARSENVIAMLSLETMGSYSDVDGSQQYPFPFDLFYPSTGNFIAFVGDLGSTSLAHQAVASFRQSVEFPSEGAAVPGMIPGVFWSDHSSFWAIGVPALMVTDTAPFRFKEYHRHDDTPDKVDGPKLARVTRGLQGVVVDLAD
ncbi:MAG: M28 family peptidase [Deltaproteobacteria bacterium]|nr:M28 family peptidase [Deltaproteobacteria bacterium]